ncbi:MAG TPA: hypothetical protein VH054_03370 [Polyangiaceae bacterium]|nr:hypothetical protein [Polyangiaceae bacterium]
MAYGRRQAVFFVAAIALHVGMFAVLPIARHSASKVRDLDEVSVDFISPTSTSTSTGTTANAHAEIARATLGHSTTTATSTGTSTETTTRTGTESVEVEAQPMPSTSSSAMPLGPAALGLGGSRSFTMELARQPLPDDSNEKLQHAITDPIHERERLNGSLTSGPFAQELERATRSDPGSPFEGRAMFSISVDEVGLVVNVQVADSTGDRRAWEDVGRRVLNAMAQRRVRVPPGAKGVAMRIEISSKVTLPSGARHPLSVSSPVVDAARNMANGQFDKGEGMNGGLPIVAGQFDLSDIGAHPMRVVGARVLSENVY